MKERGHGGGHDKGEGALQTWTKSMQTVMEVEVDLVISVGGLLSRTELRRGGRQWNEKGKGREKLARARVGRGRGAR